VGWSAILVTDDPPFAYTIGLMFTFSHPQLIIFGLRDHGHPILSTMVEVLREGGSFVPGKRYSDVLNGFDIAVREVDRSQHTEHLGYAMGYCRERGRIGELEALQVFWPDKGGHFPFEASCIEPIRALQPRLDLPLDAAARRGR
jgi:hypothetical protein